MRIMFNGDYVEEILEIDCMKGWCNGLNIETDPPCDFIVSMERPALKGFGYPDVGEYNLDGTQETYKKAEANYKSICEKLLIKGYVRDTDFENFTWY